MIIKTGGGEKRYRIGQAAKRVGVEPYVLRFWEQEFPHVRACRTAKGQRFYTEEHVRQLQRIRQLLHEEKMTIKGARQKLEGKSDVNDVLAYVRHELESLRSLLQ